MKQGITHILTTANVYDEYMSGPDSVIIPIHCLETAKKYAEEIRNMKERGLEPARISEFDWSPRWLAAMPRVTEELAKRILVIDHNDMIYYDLEEENKVCSDIEEICDEQCDPDGELRMDCSMLNAWETSFSVTANVKHTEVKVDGIVYYSSLDEAPTLHEVMQKQKQEA